MKGMRHIADIMSPSLAKDEFGQPIQGGPDSVYLGGIPCSVEPLGTRELEAARQLYATATHKVAFYGDPAKPIRHTQYLLVNGSRRMNIAEARDLDQNGVRWELIVGEAVA